MPKEPITARELMEQLESDPEWLAKRDERDRKQQAIAKELDTDEFELVRELCDAGFAIESVWDLVNNSPHPVLKRKFVGGYADAYPILIKHLKLRHHVRIREGIVRSLTVSDGGKSVAFALLAEFQCEADADLKWVIANALQTAMTKKMRLDHPEIDDYYNNYTGSNSAG